MNNVKRTILDSVSFSFLFGVIIYFIYQPTADEMLLLGRNTKVAIFLLFLSSFISYFLNSINIKTLGELLFEPPHKKVIAVHRAFYKNFWFWQLFIVTVTLVITGILSTDFSIKEIADKDGFDGAINLFKSLLDPNFEVLPKAVLNIFVTIFMAFMAMALAVPIAFILSFFAAKNIMTNPIAYVIYLLIRTFLNVIRSVEVIVWAIIFSVWVGIGPFAGMLALMVHSVASLAKQYSEMIETVQDGPIEGIISTGANKIQTIWFAIVPQVFLPFISFTVYRWDINIRMATVIGFVGGGGIGTMLQQYQGQAMWREVGTIFLVITTVVWLMDQASAYLREALK